MVKLEVTFLGTSSATPTRSRGLPSLVIRRNGEFIMLDCGEGVQRQLFRVGSGLNREAVILITHLHGDHVTGLLGLLQTMSLAQRTREITIVGPSVLWTWLSTTIKLLHIGLTFGIKFIPSKPGIVYRSKEYRIRAARAIHSVEAYSYLLEEFERPGTFYPKRAISLGIPEGRQWARLQHGRKVIVNGKTIKPDDVMGPRRPGRRVGYSGDTRPSERLAKFFSRCDLLIFDSTFASKDKEKALKRKHSTSTEAAALAKEAKVRQLVLTHFSARYRNVKTLLDEARRVFPNTVAAHDGLRLEVLYPAPG